MRALAPDTASVGPGRRPAGSAPFAGSAAPAPGSGPPADSLAALVGLETGGDDGSDARFRLFDAVADRFAAASADHPLLVVIDDLQWADPGSLLLLRFLARDPRARRLVIVATYREGAEQADRWLADAIGEVVGDGLHVRLDGLTPGEVTSLVEQLGGHVGAPTDGADGLHRRSGGNPFFVREFVRLPPGRAGGSAPAPAGVRAVVALRLEQLSPAARGVLTAAAVLGAEFRLVDLGDLVAGERGSDLGAELGSEVGSGTDALLDALDEAHAAGLVVADPEWRSFTFVHAVVQEVLYDGLRLADRARLDARAADGLERRWGERAVIEIAHHLRRAAVGGGDERAVVWAQRAADHSFDRLAYEQAVLWYGRALDLLSGKSDTHREAELLIRRAEASLAGGDVPEARDTFRQAAAVARERGDAAQLARAALGLGSGRGGFEVPLHDQTQLALLEEALTAIGPSTSELRARLLARLSVALSSSPSSSSRHRRRRRPRCPRPRRPRPMARAAGGP